MEGEISNFIMVWTLVAISLTYCHTVGQTVSSGTKRLLAIAPVIGLFFILPLSLTTISLGGLTSFFIAWLCNLKLILFAYGKGPLSSSQSRPLAYFIPIACLPIKIHDQVEGTKNGEHPRSEISESGLKSLTNYVIKMLVIVAFLPAYERKDLVHPVMLHVMYCLHVYVALEVSLAVVGAMVRALIGVGIEPQFEEPYLSTSLQDFWGRRWNLMVTNILRPTVYLPVRSISSRVIGRTWAPLPASFACFLVSGLMHELIFYYIGRKEPTWVVTSFFVLHGICVAVEIAAKKAFAGKLRLPRAVSGLMAVSFILATALWLFLPALLWCDAEDKARGEATAVVNFVKETWSVVRFSSIMIVTR
ncbi:acyl-CoA--sterol O-acyltransferase 1-like [Rhodamnia argentea]|uniref:Acyl-CoA--sterol O-acyltransferase 1-like n=1 Tax=Rhodamnia argentea TaxID=178133 RepID=A0A8B8P3D4_9MYRT|nr:acyl-CoA--sterol O-acyltransferase 1-like [Rhodamnia argentea]